MKIWASASFTEIAAGKPSSNKKSRWNLWTMQCARPKSPTRSPLCRKSLAGPGCKRLFLPRLRKCRPCLYPLRRDLLCSTPPTKSWATRFCAFARIWECTRCKLYKHRHTIVFGDGSPKAELVFVGEGPGADEDAQGLPFVGRAGKLLTQMIEAMGLERQDVYICNVVKCRPPENRTPEDDEVSTCSPFLLRQLEVISPKVIVCLGAVAAKTLLRTNRGISQFRGQWLDYRGSKLMATYHPAYLLRNPNAKGEVWKDLQKVMAVLGLQARKGKPA